MNKVRIAIVMPEIYFGGAETQFRHLVTNIDLSMFSVTVFVEQSRNSRREHASEFIDKWRDKIDFVVLDHLFSDEGIFRKLISAVRLSLNLMPYFRRDAFDVVCVYSALGMRTIPVCRLFKVPVVYSERNEARYGILERWRKSVYLRRATTIVTNSAAARRNLEELGYQPRLVRNGVEWLGRFDDQRDAPLPQILVAGRIAPVKSQETVLEAIALATDLRHVRVTFAGPVEDEKYFSYLQELVRRWQLADRVNFIEVRDMSSLYQRASVLVLPSRSEGTPNVLLEAASAGVVCVATDIESNKDVLQNSELLFKVGVPESLSDRLRYILALPLEQRDIIVETVGARVKEDFSIPRMAMNWQDVFTSALDRGAK